MAILRRICLLLPLLLVMSACENPFSTVTPPEMPQGGGGDGEGHGGIAPDPRNSRAYLAPDPSDPNNPMNGGPPTLSVREKENGTLELNWTGSTPPDLEGWGIDIALIGQVDSPINNWNFVGVVGPEVRSKTFSNLQLGQRYAFRVFPYFKSSYGDASIIYFTLSVTGTPDPRTATPSLSHLAQDSSLPLTVSEALGHKSVTLSWLTPTDYLSNLKGYGIELALIDELDAAIDNWKFYGVATPEAQSITINYLLPGQRYAFRIFPYYEQSWGDYSNVGYKKFGFGAESSSNPRLEQTFDASSPALEISITEMPDKSATLSWTPSDSFDDWPQFQGFGIEIAILDSPTSTTMNWQFYGYPDSEEPTTIPNLLPGQSYAFRIFPYSKLYFGNPSNSVIINVSNP